MRIELTVHAQQQIIRRKIALQLVLETIEHPKMLQQNGAVYYAYRAFKKRILKVVYVKETHIRVLTAYWRE
jgi:hypothetical protein